MTREQYLTYVQSVGTFLTKNKVKPGCHSPLIIDAEPFFSWQACECCGSRLGGSREAYVFATETGDTFKADVCTDCVYFLTYGELDDATMAEVNG